MKKDAYFLGLALKEAKKSLRRGDYPAGCVIVQRGKIVSKASSAGITKKDATAHAELQAIQRACRKLKSRFLKECTAYCSVEPCLMCAKAVVYARLPKVVFGAPHGEYGKQKTFSILFKIGVGKGLNIVEGIEKEQSERLLKLFYSRKITI